MPPFNENSDSDSDYGYDNEDMEALKRACQITGKDHIDHQLQLPSTSGAAAASGDASSEAESDGEGEDDLKMVRSIQKRFSVSADMDDEALNRKPLCMPPPDLSDSDDCEDECETVRAILTRFASYSAGGLKDNVEVFPNRPVQVGGTIIDSEKETSNSFVEKTNAREGFLNCVDTSSEPNGTESEACQDLVEWNGPGGDDATIGMPHPNSHLPKPALVFVDAINKNRSCQKLIRSKMMQMDSRIEELNKLIQCVKTLVDCKKRKKDARVKLISVPKLRENMKSSEKKISALYKGPPENSCVSSYKEAMEAFAVSVSGKKWSKEERENIVKGVKQQFQDMLLSNGGYGSNNVDNIMISIKDVDITPEKIRQFLPKVNWDQLVHMYDLKRSGAECQSRFLNCEDPLINHDPWTGMEDKNLLHIIQQKGLSNWIDIAASLETNRTPFQCLARYQRSLNASILKREWTKEEDNQLRVAVETYGESNWQTVASVMEGRTGTQCSNRWLKTLHPTRKRVGKWTAEEDKRLKVAVTLFGPKTWKKIAKCVPGRTQVQCRERWVNCLDPSLNMADWTEEEDSKLEMAIAEHGYCWSKVASCIPRRTDNQCWRRWKVLFPDDVPRLQAARKIQRAALISNFVDRESEKPTLGPNDFLAPPEVYRITGPENVDNANRKKRKSSESCSDEVLRLTNGGEVEKLQIRTKRRRGKGKSSDSVRKDGDPSGSNSSPCPLDLSNDEENRNSRANGGGSKEKPRVERKRSRPHTEEPSHSDPDKECSLPTLTYPNTTERAELDGVDPTQSKKPSKLHPRRRRAKIPEQVPDDHQSPFPDSMPLMEAFHGIKARKRKRNNTQQTCKNSDSASVDVDKESAVLLGDRSSPCQVEIAPDGNCVSNNESAISVNFEDNDENRPDQALEVDAGGDDNESAIPLGDKSSSCQVEIAPENAVSVVLEDNDEVETGDDDTTLAHFYNNLKKRRR